MPTTRLKELNGSSILTLPPIVSEALHLQVGAVLDMSVDGDHIVIRPKPKLTYNLDDLLAQCNFDLPITPEEREWLDSKPIGLEEI